MSKSGSRDLFLLIKSLTKSEKWHFKLYASGRSDSAKNNYVKFFDAIEKQKEYDEKSLLRTEDYIKQLPLLKNRLYEKIMESLDVLYARHSIDSKMQHFIHYIEILFEKGLYKQCDNIIQKAKELAVKHEKFLYLAEILKWEIDMMRIRSYAGKTENDVRQAFREISSAIEKNLLINKYYKLHSELFIKIKKEGFPRSRKTKEAFQKIIAGLPEANGKKDLPFMAEYYYYQYHIVYELSQNNSKKRYAYIKKQLALFEKYPLYKKEMPQVYLGVLHNACLCFVDFKEDEKILKMVEEIKKIPGNTERSKAAVYYSFNYLSMTLFVNTGDFDKGISLLNKLIKEGLDQYVPKHLAKQHAYHIYYFAAYIYFGGGNYQKANYFLNKILNDPDRSEDDFRGDLHCFTKIFSIIVRFEMGKVELLEYTIRSTYRYLLKRNRLYKFENIILGFLRKNSTKIATKKHLIQSFKILRTELENIVKDPYEKRALSYFDFISWLDSKIENIPFADTIRRNYKKAD